MGGGGDFVLGDFVQGDFVWGILSGGFCPGGFCLKIILSLFFITVINDVVIIFHHSHDYV